MKVAYILEGIAQGWLTYELDTLKDIGVEIDFNPNNPVTYGDFTDYMGADRKSFGRDVLNLSGLLLRSPSKTNSLLDVLRRYAGWQIAISTLAMAGGIKQRGAEIIHAHFATGPAASAMVVSELTGIPYAFTVHAYDIFNEPIDWKFLAEKCRRAAFVRCISEFNREYLLKKSGVDDHNFFVIPCGVDTERFKPDLKEDPIAKEEKVILTVAGLVQKKGIPFLLKALSDPSVKRLGRKLVIAGVGPMKSELVREVSRLGIDVEFLGNVKNYELETYYRRAELFVLPCITEPNGQRDGIPVVMMEAMASGVPVISSNISGIPELVEDGKNGILTPEKNVGAIANAIKTLVKDNDLRKRFSVEGRKKVIEKFDINDVAKRLKELFIKYSKVEK